MGVLEEFREFTTGSVGCPHPEARERHAVYVRDGSGPPMALCGACRGALAGLVERRAGREEVFRTMAGLGYARSDARRFWFDWRRGTRRQRWTAWLARLLPRREVLA